DVARDDLAGRGELAGGLVEVGASASREDYRGAHSGEAFGDGGADAASGAGDQGGLAGEGIGGHRVLSRVWLPHKQKRLVWGTHLPAGAHKVPPKVLQSATRRCLKNIQQRC